MELNMIQVQQVMEQLVIPMELQLIMNMKKELIRLKQDLHLLSQQTLKVEILTLVNPEFLNKETENL